MSFTVMEHKMENEIIIPQPESFEIYNEPDTFVENEEEFVLVTNSDQEVQLPLEEIILESTSKTESVSKESSLEEDFINVRNEEKYEEEPKYFICPQKMHFLKAMEGTLPSEYIQVTMDEYFHIFHMVEHGEYVFSGSNEENPLEVVKKTTSLEELIKMYDLAVEEMLNTEARKKGYADIRSAALRAAIPESPFYQEGKKYAIWMDEVYSSCYKIQNDVFQGKREIPTVEELLSELPKLNLGS